MFCFVQPNNKFVFFMQVVMLIYFLNIFFKLLFLFCFDVIFTNFQVKNGSQNLKHCASNVKGMFPSH